MDKLIVGLLLVKQHSKRLPGKNTKDFNGKQMFLWNLEKCRTILDRVYVSSDSNDILLTALHNGAIPIQRGAELCGDVPDIPVYQHALRCMGDVDGVVAVHANNPTVGPGIILAVRKMLEMGFDEVMTCHPVEKNKNYHQQGAKIYGSVRGLSKRRIEEYGDPYSPQPQVLVADESVEIETPESYKEALCQSRLA